MAWKPIVVGVDGSPESVRAAVTGSMIAEKAGAECVIVHAVPDYLASFTAPDVSLDVSGLEDMAMEHAREFITGTLKGDVRPELLAGLRSEVGCAPIVGFNPCGLTRCHCCAGALAHGCSSATVPWAAVGIVRHWLLIRNVLSWA